MASRNAIPKQKSAKSAMDAATDNPKRELESSPLGELEKVRSILFGEQSRHYEVRLSEIEEALTRSMAELRQMMADKLQSLEHAIDARLDLLSERIDEERAERELLRELMVGDVKNVGEQIEQSQAEMGERLGEMMKELTDEREKASKLLNEKIEALARSVGSIDHEKTNRVDLAKMLTHIAQELQRDDARG